MTLPKSIVMMEDHDKAYHAWKERGVCARTLVHVDAHIDFGWVPDMDLDEIDIGVKGFEPLTTLLLNPFTKTRKKMVNIGNYICPAMRDGMVKKFYWIVPDESWRNKRGRAHIMRYLKQLRTIKKHAGGALESDDRQIRFRMFDKEVIICTLDNLECIEAPVLLDIDVDFMLTASIWDDLNPERTPWIYPEELFEKLNRKIADIDVLTIAYSVEGGFTPLRFKCLGDELRALFAGEMTDDKRKMVYYKRNALACEKEGRVDDAIATYEKVLDIDGRDAPAYFNLSLLHLRGTACDGGKAAYFYNEAVKADRTYSTAYNNYGILYLRHNKPKRAEVEYRKFLGISENNSAALNGLGHLALRKREYARAGELFDRCLSADKAHADARLGKAVTEFRAGRLYEAEQAFRGLKEDAPDNQEIHWWLGRIAEKIGDTAAAIDSYKNAVMLGGDGPLVHLQLLRLYMIKGFYFRAFEELKRYFQMLKGSF